MTTKISTADGRLIAEVNAMGLTVEPRQLKRWRAEGVLPSPERGSAGRGQGRVSLSYPDGTATQVAVILELLQQGRSMREIALTLFLRGFTVSERALRASFDATLQRFELKETTDEERADAADRIATKVRAAATLSPLGRSVIERAGTYGARKDSTVEDAIAGVTGAFLIGAEPSTESVSAIGIVYGFESEHLPEAGTLLADLDVSSLRAVLASATLSELVYARRCMIALIGAAQVLQSSPANEFGLAGLVGVQDWELGDETSHAVGILAMARVLQLNPELRTIMAAAATQAAQDYDPADHER